MISMILCHYMQRAHSASNRPCCNIPVFHYGIIVLVSPSVRVPRFKTKRLLPGIESVANNWPKGCLVRARILSQETPFSDAAPLT